MNLCRKWTRCRGSLWHPGEDSASYVRRRGRLAAGLCREHGLWSRRWCLRVVSWDAHLKRPRNSGSWAAQVEKFHDASWFGIRLACLSPSGSAGTGTRSALGRPFPRWHEGCQLAKQVTCHSSDVVDPGHDLASKNKNIKSKTFGLVARVRALGPGGSRQSSIS